jgi:hypothetical protein
MSLRVSQRPALASIAQVALVVCLSLAMSYAVAHANFRSPLNIIWMFMLPIVLRIILNRDPYRQTAMAVVLIIASVAGIFLALYLFGIY